MSDVPPTISQTVLHLGLHCLHGHNATGTRQVFFFCFFQEHGWIFWFKTEALEWKGIYLAVKYAKTQMQDVITTYLVHTIRGWLGVNTSCFLSEGREWLIKGLIKEVVLLQVPPSLLLFDGSFFSSLLTQNFAQDLPTLPTYHLLLLLGTYSFIFWLGFLRGAQLFQ